MMSTYRGRFAPSPTGPLHFGSLVAAVASYCEAMTHGGEWVVRIEDLDKPRIVPGAAEGILRTLEALGFNWQGEVLRQSRRSEAYEQALSTLQSRQRVFACACSRREIADSSLRADGDHAYPGTCRNGLSPGRVGRTLRLRVDDDIIEFNDAIQGTVRQRLATEVGDFVLRRADGLFAYQLAVVVDDAAQGITHVVRGSDLLDSTPRQILLQRLLHLPQPAFMHVPIAVNSRGEKLSKQTLAPPIPPERGGVELPRALRFLGQAIPEDLFAAPPAEIWGWALAHWDVTAVPRRREQPIAE